MIPIITEFDEKNTTPILGLHRTRETLGDGVHRKRLQTLARYCGDDGVEYFFASLPKPPFPICLGNGNNFSGTTQSSVTKISVSCMARTLGK